MMHILSSPATQDASGSGQKNVGYSGSRSASVADSAPATQLSFRYYLDAEGHVTVLIGNMPPPPGAGRHSFGRLSLDAMGCRMAWIRTFVAEVPSPRWATACRG